MSAKGKVLNAVVQLSGKVDPSLAKSMQQVEKKLDGVDAKATAVGAAIGAALTAGLVFAGKKLIEFGDSYNTALNDMQARTGATAAEMEGLNEVLQNVYKAGYGESFEDVASGLSKIQQTTGLVGDELEAVAKGAYALSETFDYDVSESARAAKAMMTNFGVSGADALNLIAAGAQNGLDYSNELIDSVNEYSVQFAKLGFTAEDMFKIFQSGADSGAWNLDKVGDAIKEFSIRSIDGSKTSTEAYEALGLNADEMFQTFTKGGDEATAAFHEVIVTLMDMDDKVARDAAGVGLFGTMWEDLGTEAFQALADMEAGAYSAGGELEKIQQLKYNSVSEALEAVKRNLEVGLLPAAQTVAGYALDAIPKINAAIEWLGENIGWVGPLVGGLASAFIIYNGVVAASTVVTNIQAAAQTFSAAKTALATAATTAQTTATTIWTTVSSIAATATTALGAAFAFLTSPIGLVVLAITAVIAIGVLLYKNWDVVKEKAAAVGQFLANTWGSIKDTLGGLVDGITEKFRTGFTALVGIVKAPVNTVIGMVNSVIEKINGVGFDIPEWVPVVGGKKFTVNIPTIPMLAAGGFTDGLSIAGEAGTEAVISFDKAYRQQNLNTWAQAGQMLGADAEDYSLAGGTTTTNIVMDGVSFAPNITVQGNASKEDIISAIRDQYPEFMDMLEEWLSERGDFAYGN